MKHAGGRIDLPLCAHFIHFIHLTLKMYSMKYKYYYHLTWVPDGVVLLKLAPWK